MTNYYDGARAEEARLWGGARVPQPETEGPLLSDLLKALEMSEKIGLDRHRTQELRDAIGERLFGTKQFFNDVTEAELYEGWGDPNVEDAEIIEEDEDW